MSLDGFVADPSGSASRLYPDLKDLQGTDYMNAAIAVTRAVVMGRKTFEMGDPDSVMLGAGLRLFDGVEAKLEKTRVQEVGPRTSFEFRVVG
jgi:hypothetical protein